MPESTAAVFLDRDGVLCEVELDGRVPQPPRSIEKLTISHDAKGLLARLKDLGFLLVIVSNQPDVARGNTSLATVEEINGKIAAELHIDAVYFCPHDNDDGCWCRKPKPGMVLRAASELSIDLDNSFLIGDRWVDIAAAEAAGIDGLLLERPYSWDPTSAGSPPPGLGPRYRGATLEECVEFIVASAYYG